MEQKASLTNPKLVRKMWPLFLQERADLDQDLTTYQLAEHFSRHSISSY